MKIRISDLWSWEGTIDRGAYALTDRAITYLRTQKAITPDFIDTSSYIQQLG